MAEKKRGNGEGSGPRKRSDGRWEARYTDADGKRRSVYGKTRREVAGRLAEALAKRSEPKPFVPKDISVRESFAEYQSVARDTMKRRSFETSRDIMRLHLLPAFGDKKLSRLTREDVQGLYAWKRDDGLSPATIKRMHDVLAAALNVAVRWRYVERNVCKEVSRPRVPLPEIRPFSQEEARRLLSAAEGNRYEALYVLGLTTGARWGELAGLFWRDLDVERQAMHIQRALVRGYDGYAFEPPKTRGSRRTVALSRLAIDALVRHRKRQVDEGSPVSGDALVFTNTVGKPLHASNFIRRNFNESPVTEQELEILLEEGARAGVFEHDERDLARRALRLDDRPVRDLMTPRPRVVWLDADGPPEEVRRKAAESRHSYFPVARGALDDLLGIASVKDAWARNEAGQPPDLLASLRRAPLVPEGAPATAALEAFKRSGLPLALVLDERGNMEGLVTLTDVLEALVGAVPDVDAHAEEPSMVLREDGSWLVDGLLAADELKDRLGLEELPREEEADYQTVGGMVMDALGRVPEVGDRLEWEGYSFEVVDMDGRRVDKVLVSPPTAEKTLSTGLGE